MIAVSGPQDPAESQPSSGDSTPPPGSLDGLDTFPYRHRVGDLMTHPVAVLPSTASLQEAVACMTEREISSVLILDADQHAHAILTERDVLCTLATHGAEALQRPFADFASHPVQTIREDSFVYVALGRMSRLNLRHLVCVDTRGHATGMITARGLLAQRAHDSLRLADHIAEATSSRDLRQVMAALPALAHALVADAVPALRIAAVLSGIARDLTRRACQLTEQAMRTDSRWGPPPAEYAVLVLGDAGRAESLLAMEPLTALVHTGDPSATAWFLEFGQRVCTLLDEAGVPADDPARPSICAAAWNQSLGTWESKISAWISTSDAQELAQVDPFFDFVTVHGNTTLSGEVRRIALNAAHGANPFLKLLSINLAEPTSGLGLFGRFRTDHGRMDLGHYGLRILAQCARILALSHTCPATSSIERMRATAARCSLSEDDQRAFETALETVCGVLLRQQLDDVADHQKPGSLINPSILTSDQAEALRQALKLADRLALIVHASVGQGPMVPLPGA